MSGKVLRHLSFMICRWKDLLCLHSCESQEWHALPRRDEQSGK